MTEMVTSGSMSGEEQRSDGLLGESDHERRRLLQAPPVLHATALLLDSTEPFFTAAWPSRMNGLRPTSRLGRLQGPAPQSVYLDRPPFFLDLHALSLNVLTLLTL